MSELLGIYLSGDGLTIHTKDYKKRFIIHEGRVIQVDPCHASNDNLVVIPEKYVNNIKIDRGYYAVYAYQSCVVEIQMENNIKYTVESPNGQFLYLILGNRTIARSNEKIKACEEYLIEKYGPLAFLTVQATKAQLCTIPEDYIVTGESYYATPKTLSFTGRNEYSVIVLAGHLSKFQSHIEKHGMRELYCDIHTFNCQKIN